MDHKSVEKLYHSQNITIRKNIRELDMGLATSSSSKRNDVNILVVGPEGAGKGSLLKTVFYALNGSLSYTIQTRQTSNAIYEHYEIKKNKKYSVEGLSKMKETDDKLGISGYIVKAQNDLKNPIEKYSRGIQVLGGKVFGCMNALGSNTSINYVLVCLSMVQKISKEEMIGLRFFIADLEEKRVKYTIVGTQLDKILGTGLPNSDASFEMEQQKAIYMENWKQFVMNEVVGKGKPDIYCMENYSTFRKQNFENSQTVNFYALNLLQQMIKQAEVWQKERSAQKKSLSCGNGSKMLWFCS